jgi:hypothetical protein
MRAGRAAASLCAALVALGCGEDDPPKPDREQVRELIHDFFQDAANGDVEAVCAALTGVGRAQAAGRGQIIGRPPVPVSEERCIERRAHTAIVSVDLPLVVDALRIERIRVRSRTATVYVCNWALCRPQLVRRQPTGSWRIESFQLPVND